ALVIVYFLNAFLRPHNPSPSNARTSVLAGGRPSSAGPTPPCLCWPSRRTLLPSGRWWSRARWRPIATRFLRGRRPPCRRPPSSAPPALQQSSFGLALSPGLLRGQSTAPATWHLFLPGSGNSLSSTLQFRLQKDSHQHLFLWI
ncbi:hypothetical protein U9M48_017518, partial [Paspalum notatum var. saurae]